MLTGTDGTPEADLFLHDGTRFLAPPPAGRFGHARRPTIASGTIAPNPITRTIRGVASEVVVGIDCGLKSDSAINLHHVVTIPKAGLRRFVGTVHPDILAKVRVALLFALGFE